MTTGFISVPLAMAGSGGDGQAQQSPVMMIGWLVIMVLLFYFMLIRPQQRKEKERRALMANVKSGDKVVFGGGMVGTIANVKDHVFVIKIADNTKVDVLKGAVTRVLGKDEDLGNAGKE